MNGQPSLAPVTNLLFDDLASSGGGDGDDDHMTPPSRATAASSDERRLWLGDPVLRRRHLDGVGATSFLAKLNACRALQRYYIALCKLDTDGGDETLRSARKDNEERTARAARRLLDDVAERLAWALGVLVNANVDRMLLMEYECDDGERQLKFNPKHEPTVGRVRRMGVMLHVEYNAYTETLPPTPNEYLAYQLLAPFDNHVVSDGTDDKIIQAAFDKWLELHRALQRVTSVESHGYEAVRANAIGSAAFYIKGDPKNVSERWRTKRHIELDLSLTIPLNKVV